MNHRILGLAALALAALLTGCSPGGTVNQDLTPEQAKADAQRLERDITDAIPADTVADVDQLQQGSMLRCEDDGTYSWSGGTDITLTAPPASEEAFLEDLASAFETTQLRDDGSTLVVSGTAGQSAVISFNGDALVSISSASACFVLPDDMHPLDTF